MGQPLRLQGTKKANACNEAPTHLPRVGLGTISGSSDITRFVQGGVVKIFRCTTYRSRYHDSHRVFHFDRASLAGHQLRLVAYSARWQT